MRPITNIPLLFALVLFIFTAIVEVNAQVFVESRYASTQMIHVKDLQNFSINNSSGSPFQCIIQIEITKDDKIVSIGESSPILLPLGNTNMLTWRGGDINQRPNHSNISAIRSDGTFSSGAYMACIKVLDLKDRAELSVNCEAFSVIGSKDTPYSINNVDKKEKKKSLSSSMERVKSLVILPIKRPCPPITHQTTGMCF